MVTRADTGGGLDPRILPLGLHTAACGPIKQLGRRPSQRNRHSRGSRAEGWQWLRVIAAKQNDAVESFVTVLLELRFFLWQLGNQHCTRMHPRTPYYSRNRVTPPGRRVQPVPQLAGMKRD